MENRSLAWSQVHEADAESEIPPQELDLKPEIRDTVGYVQTERLRAALLCLVEP